MQTRRLRLLTPRQRARRTGRIAAGAAVALVATWALVAWLHAPQVGASAAPPGDSAGIAPAEAGGTDTAASPEGGNNGELPDDALTEVEPGHRLVTAAARAFTALREAAAQDGYTMTVNSAYRTIAEQEALVEQYGLLSDGGRAAAPGTSEHGWGTAIDLELDYEALGWMRENAASFGFAETISTEPWHWNYLGTP